MRILLSLIVWVSLPAGAAAPSPKETWRKVASLMASQGTLGNFLEALPMPKSQRDEALNLLRTDRLQDRLLPTPKLLEDGIQVDTDFGPLKIQSVNLSEREFMLNGRHLRLKGLGVRDSYNKIREALDKVFRITVWSLLVPRVHAVDGNLQDISAILTFLSASLGCEEKSSEKCVERPPQSDIATLTKNRPLTSFSCEQRNGKMEFGEASTDDYSITYGAEKKGSYSIYSARVFAKGSDGTKKELCSVNLTELQNPQRDQFTDKSSSHALCKQWKEEFGQTRVYDFDKFQNTNVLSKKIPLKQLIECCAKPGCPEAVRATIKSQPKSPAAEPSGGYQ